mgnify:FL=1
MNLPDGIKVRGASDPQCPVLTFRSIYSRDLRLGILEGMIGSVYISLKSEEIRFFFLDDIACKLYFYLRKAPGQLHLKQKIVSATDDPSNGILSNACIIIAEFEKDLLLPVEQFLSQLGFCIIVQCI